MRWLPALLLAVAASACGSPAGFVTATTTPPEAVAVDLDATFELPEVGYVIDHPSSWATGSFGSVSGIAASAEALETGPAGALDDPFVVFEYLPIAETARVGLGPDATARDLAALNLAYFRLAPTDEIEDAVVAAAAAATFVTTDEWGNHVMAIQGVLNGYAYRLFMHTSDAAQFEMYRPTWEAMVESFRPAQ